MEILEFISKINTALNNLNNWFKNNRKDIQNIINHILRFDEIAKDNIKTLMTQSWFIDFEFLSINEIYDIADNFKLKKVIEANSQMMKLYDSIIPKLETRLINQYPNRREIFSDIFRAYESNYFAVTIPCIFSQIDGICVEKLGGELFQRIKKEGVKVPKAVKNLKLSDNDSIWSILAFCLFESNMNPVLMNNYERKMITDEIFINRHQIIHGEDYSYATKLNTVKAFSLLAYVSSIIEIYEENI